MEDTRDDKKCWWEILKGKTHFRYLGVDWRILLK
jgi:hypothetical protein